MTATKTRNLVFVGSIALILCATLGLKALYRMGIPLPETLGTANENSHLEGKVYQKHPNASLASFEEGTLQSELEGYLADAVPYRDGILLANAGLQRIGIATAAGIFGFDAYPTFYGSNYTYLPAEGVVCQTSEHWSERPYSTLAANLATRVAEYPEVDFVLYTVPRPRTAYYESSAELVSNPETSSDVSNYLQSVVGEGLTVIDSSPETFSNYRDAFFRTDHHWNITGAYQAYEDIASALGFGDQLIKPTAEVSFDEPVFYGSHARAGLITNISDHIVDYTFDLPSYTTTANDEPLDISTINDLELYQTGNWATDSVFRDRYGEYYHSDYSELVLERTEKNGAGELLIIADSYSNCMERLFLAHYDTVRVLDPRYVQTTVSQYLVEHPSITDVVILACPTTLTFTTVGQFFA